MARRKAAATTDETVKDEAAATTAEITKPAPRKAQGEVVEAVEVYLVAGDGITLNNTVLKGEVTRDQVEAQGGSFDWLLQEGHIRMGGLRAVS